MPLNIVTHFGIHHFTLAPNYHLSIYFVFQDLKKIKKFGRKIYKKKKKTKISFFLLKFLKRR